MHSNVIKIFCRNLAAAKKAPSTVKSTPLKISESVINQLNTKLGFNLIHAEVKNLSWKHDEPRDSEKYLDIVVVSETFEKQPKTERLKAIKSLLKDDLKKLDEKNVTFNLLTPSKWYDSNQRGLKLKEKFCEPPVLSGNLEKVSKSFYKSIEKSISQDAKRIAEALARKAAEEEAKKVAEEEAKKVAEEEAKKVAEEEAKKVTESETVKLHANDKIEEKTNNV